MRTGGWILLFISFVFGIITARSIAYFFLNTKPVEIVYSGPAVKILVAQKEIPAGTEITAEYVVFRDIPVNEIPKQAIVDFMQVYRRRPAYPLIPGCPICEDLLLPKTTAADSSTAEYLPAGSQIVSLEIGQLRVGNNVIEINKPLTEFIQSGGKIDIRCVPQQTETGEYIRLKNLVLDKYSSQEGNSDAAEGGKTVLENISVHHLNVKKSSGGKKIQNISLLLENGQAEKLAAAAREGRLRIVPHSGEQTEKQTEQTNYIKSNTELTKTAVPRSSPAQNSPALAAELQIPPQETFQQVLDKPVLSQPVRLLDSAVYSVPEPEYALPEVAISSNIIERHNEVSFAVPEITLPKIAVNGKEKICNDAAAVSISLPSYTAAIKTAAAETPAIKKTAVITTSGTVMTDKSNKASGAGIQIGLPSVQQNGYSPFLHSSVKPQTGTGTEESSETLSEPLPLKAKFR